MNTIDNKSVQTKTFRWKRWQRWAVGTGCALAAYSAAGFWLVPYVIKNQLPKFAEKELARQASIADVRFNPFTLRLEAEQIAFTEAASADGKNGAPLLSIGALAVQLEWKSIVRRAWSLAEIRVTAPQAQLTITPDGKFNLAEVLATWQRNHPEKSEGGMPRLVIAHFALEQGKVDWQDQKAGYADNFTPINFTLDNISTLPDANGSYSLSADAARGGKLHWRGTASLSPIRGEGELILNDASLPGLAAYLKAYTRATVTSGKLSARLPYVFSYADGNLEATVKGAGLALRDLALVQGDVKGKGEPFTSLTTLGIAGVNADLARQSVTVDKINLYGGKVAVRRDAKGEIDVANLMLPGNPAPAASAAPAKPGKWKVDLKQLALANVDVSVIDETVSPALQLSAKQLQLNLQLALQQGPAGMATVIDGAHFALADLAMQRGAQTPLKLAQLGFTDGKIDLAAHTVYLGAVTASGAQIDLARNRQGEFTIAQQLPVFTSGKADAGKETPSAPWSTKVDKVELSKFGARFDDAGTGIKGTLQDARLSLHNVSNDMKQALPFELGVGLREGGVLTAKGKFVPGTGAVDAQLNLQQLTLAPVQPLLAQHVKLKLAGGTLSGSGRLTTGGGAPKAPKVRYEGGVDIAGLVLNETDGKRFASWKSVRADKLTASVGPDFVDIPELRVVEPNAQLIIENDRSLNAQRLLLKAPEPVTAPAPVTAATPAPDAAFPVRVRRVRLQNAKLDFADLSLRPQFAAKIYELNGVITGLSTKRDARSQIELDGRIDEFGLARVRGQLNPFAPTDNTDLNVVFKNVDMVSASPYTMKFAGYKVAEGKISLDLQYKVRNRQLDGTNQIVLDKLTLGERIDSPDALKLPLELALAILKDSDGRIDLGLPVSGDMNDPQFSYGALIWKAVGNVLTKIVTAPFRALGNLLGISADKLESIDFDAGSAVLLPPEREKLKQVAQILAKREQLKLAVPGQYSDTDAAALRAQAVRRAVAAKAGIKLEAGEEPGPVNLGERKVRGALRELYGERFGKAELDKQKKAAESAVPATAAAAATSAAASTAAPAKIPVLQRLGKLIEGEPQVADTGAFYNGLREQLEAKQLLPADALNKLGAQRSAAILAALQQDGTPAARVSAGAPEKTEAAPGKLVGLKLGLAAQ